MTSAERTPLQNVSCPSCRWTKGRRREVLPSSTALVATSLDLVTDPSGLSAGLWEGKVDGAYAPEAVGNSGRCGVPVLNYWGWLIVVVGAMLGHVRLFPEGRPGSRLPLILLLPQYLASAGWAIRHRSPVYLLYSALFPLVLYLGLKEQHSGDPGYKPQIRRRCQSCAGPGRFLRTPLTDAR